MTTKPYPAPSVKELAMLFVYLKSGECVELPRAVAAEYGEGHLVVLDARGCELARWPQEEVTNFSERNLRAILQSSEGPPEEGFASMAQPDAGVGRHKGSGSE
jgi:hypothetical protein